MAMQEINETISILQSLGIQPPRWIYLIIIVVILLGIVLPALAKTCSTIWNGIKFVKSLIYNENIKDFVEVRSSFVGHLEHEVEKLNRESDWNDSLNYTELEAEVEVRQYTELDLFKSKNPIIWISNLTCFIKNFRNINSLEKIEKNLTEAIIRSKFQAFIVIGDPGSGKTVSLRHVFLEMAKKAKTSKSKDAVVPVYLNLKQLSIEPGEISADKIHDWIISQLVTGKDRAVCEFVNNEFEEMLKKGRFFFLFDSFDEIPSVMDAQEDNEIISKYSEAIDSFLHAESKRRGLVSSRPYRSPKKIDAQKLTILPLSNKRIQKALRNYLRQRSSLHKKIWDDLVQREDLLHVVRNPFYLALLVQYCKENESLPQCHYDLFEHFVQNRAKTDEDRLSHLGFTAKQLMQHAEILAFTMTNTPNIGLEANIDQIREITNNLDKASGWDSSKVEALISALTYSKLGRKSEEDIDKPISFSFVHRRFHEYFCARYFKREYQSAPFEALNSDNRWREVLVLLCEVLPLELLNKIFELSVKSLKEGNSANLGSKEHKKAFETILFLKDGFKSRIEDVPKNIRTECSIFIKRQFQDKNLLNQKRALEALIIADTESDQSIIESAFEQNSRYLNETAFRSCRVLQKIPTQISVSIRKSFFSKYANMKIHQQYAYYSVLFSSSSVLQPFNSFLKMLLIATALQTIFCLVFLIYLVETDLKNILSIIDGITLFLFMYFFHSLLKYNDGFELTNFKNRLQKNFYFENFLSENIILSEIVGDLSFFSISIIVNPLVMFSLSMFIAFSGYVLWLIPIISSLILYFTIYFETISSVFSFIQDILLELKLPIILKLLIFVPIFWVLLPIITPLFVLKITLWDPLKQIFVCWKEKHELNIKKLKLFLSSIFIYWTAIALLVTSTTFVDINNNNLTFVYSEIISSIFKQLYMEYNLTFAVIIILTDVLFFLAIIYYSTMSIYSVLRPIIYYMRDQPKIYIFCRSIRKGNISTAEALEDLKLLKTEGAKAQYVNTLLKWLPVDENSHLIIEEAIKNRGEVRDLLFQLAEIWENSINKKIDKS